MSGAAQKIILSNIEKLTNCEEQVRCISLVNMGKKRKAGRPAAKEEEAPSSKFHVEERFDDSEDEFQTGRDHILLDEAPEAKRRRRVAEEGKLN